jgi:hypothetical protein
MQGKKTQFGNSFMAYFGHTMSGPVAAGNRMYVQGSCYLYCIGPAVQGTPADDPSVVAAIRAGKDVEKHLTSPSAQYRYEAVKQAKGPAELLRRIIADDPYEEIRLAAIAALDAADPAGQAGWQALVETGFKPAYGTDIAYGQPGHREQQQQRTFLPLIFRCLGEPDGSALIARRWPQAAKDPVQRRALTEIAAALRCKIPPLTAAETGTTTKEK